MIEVKKQVEQFIAFKSIKLCNNQIQLKIISFDEV